MRHALPDQNLAAQFPSVRRTGSPLHNHCANVYSGKPPGSLPPWVLITLLSLALISGVLVSATVVVIELYSTVAIIWVRAASRPVTTHAGATGAGVEPAGSPAANLT